MIEATLPPPLGVEGEGVEPAHWLWHPWPQYGSVLPHQPNWLQHSPPGQSAPPACFPHCSAKAPSDENRVKMTNNKAFILLSSGGGGGVGRRSEPMALPAGP
ncbi:hypothetical protein C4D60_Mb01t05060 [Musa balbisiana]|uniref:Uncharacterized protein n=1 Tax=Musa balbisiana TaxID=52838 RepID=A0A4S8JLA2_MUSBA|nr:hypothetical protein C4D60_Mb01t05060 [Musa balbisiana]